jgi:hypothetical protein
VNSEETSARQFEPAALRDAADILDRSAADEADAVDARARYRQGDLPVIEPDVEIARRLRPGEQLVEVRPAAMIGRAFHAGDSTASDSGSAGASSSAESLAGRLYVTTERLVVLGRTGAGTTATAVDAELAVGLSEIDELAVVGERLLLSLSDGTGLTIDAGRPRLLRVQIAAARAASRVLAPEGRGSTLLNPHPLEA